MPIAIFIILFSLCLVNPPRHELPSGTALIGVQELSY